MNFYRSTNHRKFIATDSKMSVVITKSESSSSINASLTPYNIKDDNIYEESSLVEFLSEYDKTSAFINAVAKSKKE